jgi:hypothetical protein
MAGFWRIPAAPLLESTASEGTINVMSSDYTLPAAFEDISRAVLASGQPLDYDKRIQGGQLLHTLVRAGHAAGLPDDPQAWPASPAAFLASTMAVAGAPQQVTPLAPGCASSWAMREAAAELQISLIVTADQLHELDPETRAEAQAERAADTRVATELIEHAESMIDGVGDSLPAPDELEEFDQDLAS